jgi:hypothetical protein
VCIVVYPAGKSRHYHWFAALQAAGVPLQASWLTWEYNISGEEPDDEAYREHLVRCLQEASEANIVLLYCQEDDAPQFGSIMEAASALSHGKWCYLVSPHPWPFLRNHPRCRSFKTLAEAVTALMARAAGERARSERSVA